MPKYDLAVVGAAFGGLATAALASRLRKKTVVLEPGEAAGGILACLRKNGFLFDSGPRLTFGFQPGDVLQQLTENLGVPQNASLRSPCFQVALPDRRVTVYADQPETLDELRREFPNEIDTIAGFYRKIRRQSLRRAKGRISEWIAEVRSARAFLGRYRFSREFTAFLNVQSFYFFDNPVNLLPLSALITLCDSAPLTLERGLNGLGERMAEALLKNGGEIRYRVPFREIKIKGGTLSAPGETIEAEAILVNREPGQKSAFLCLGIREEAVPVGMHGTVLCVPDYDHPERFFTISLSDGNDGAAAPPGTRALTAAFSGWNEQSLNERLSRIKTLIPFMDEFLIFAEECGRAPRTVALDDDISMKAVDTNRLLMRTSHKGLYVLLNGGTPEQSVLAGRRFIQQIR